MRHEQVAARDTYAKVDIAAVWPTSPQVAPIPVVDAEDAAAATPFASTAAAPDVPAAVGKMLIGAYVGLLSAFTIATAGSAQSIFAIIVAAVFMVAFFTVPILFLREEPESGAHPNFDRFMRDGINTLTGKSSGREALVQMLIVPVFLTCAALAMGITAAIFL